MESLAALGLKLREELYTGKTAALQEINPVEGHCGACGHNAFCKGGRAIVQLQTGDWLAADNNCALVE